MPFLRALIAAVLFMAWMPATNACALAGFLPGQVEDCCEHDQNTDSSGCDGVKSCATCVALENGVQRDLLQPFSLPSPTFAELELLSQFFESVAADVVDELPPVRSDHPPLQAPLWHFVSRTAVPVRGPSALA